MGCFFIFRFGISNIFKMLLHIITTLLVFYHSEAITIKISDGEIVGTTAVTEGLKREFYAFKGIPYAEPPERFELAVAKKPWKGVLNCTYDKDQCIQGGGIGGTPIGSEDCLFLSVYSRNLTKKSPVLVWIHGGAFETGNATYESNPPDYLIDEGLVVVQIQYRLGIFGFMSTEDIVVPGNLGLKDQVLALKWIQKNINYFGGDPKNVTIMGQSAGGVSVAMHLNSPKSKGLFKGAIMNSGTTLCLWALNRRAAQTAFSVGTSLGIITTKTTKLVRKLKEVDAKKLQNAAVVVSWGIAIINPLKSIPWAPVKEVAHDTAFFTGKSADLLSRGDINRVPVLAGSASNEAGGDLDTSLTFLFRLYFFRYDLNSLDLVPADLTNNIINRAISALKIKKEFFGDSLFTLIFAPTNQVMQFIDVDVFARPIKKFVEFISTYVPTYYYMYSYEGDIKKQYAPDSIGVQHSEDLNYIFGRNYNYSDEDKLIRSRTVRMWANFCKYSTPTPEPEPLLGNVTWAPYSSSNKFMMNINRTLASSSNPFQKYLEFYEDLYKKYGDNDYDTY